MKTKSKIDWEYKRLDELGFVGRGKSKQRPRNDPALYGGDYPFIQTGEIKAADLYISEYTQTYNEKGLAQSKLWEPETLCITIAANIAETAILKIRACFPDSIVGFIADPQKSDVRFVKYYLDTLKSQMQSISRGTTQDNLPVEKLLSFKLATPTLSIQRKIASVLSAYDDLVESNTKRIKVVEELAKRIYREWFVDFRFPGYKKAKFINSNVGKIPDSWQVITVGDAIDCIESGSRPKGGIDPSEKGVPSIGAENVLGLGQYEFDKEKYVSKSFFEKMRRGVVKNGDILLYKDGAKIGRKSMFRDGFPHEVCCINEHAFILRANSRCSQNYLYFYLDRPDITQMIIGLNANAAQPGINQPGVKGLPFLLPERRLIDLFDAQAEPLIGLLFNLAKKNKFLREERDDLLPKLISGEINVSEMDIAIREQANVA